MDLDNKLDLIWRTNIITNKITDRITDKITDMTNKLQMLITFVTVVRLRPTIYQNAQNSKENPDKGIWYTIFCQKNPLTTSISCSKIKHPFSFFFFSFFLISATSFFTWNRTQTYFFLHKVWKTQEQEQKTWQEQEQERKKDTNKKTNNRTRTKHEPGKITKKKE